MLKQYKPEGILSSAAILAPALLGQPLWSCLLLLGLHWAALAFTALDQEGRDQSPKAIRLLYCIMPGLSWLMLYMEWGIQRPDFDPMLLLNLGMGALFLAMGNYMPKLRRNSTYGIKVSWALDNEENWNATHRFGGKIWFAAGLGLLLTPLMPEPVAVGAMVILLTLAALLPVLYSWSYARKQKAAGTWTADRYKPHYGKYDKAIKIGMACFFGALLLFIGLMMFTGSLTFEFGADALTADGSWYDAYTVRYADIRSVELRAEPVPGTRTWGYGSPKLLMGTFTNEEFGNYTRYTYTKADTAVIVTTETGTLVLADKDAAATEKLYRTLLEKCK